MRTHPYLLAGLAPGLVALTACGDPTQPVAVADQPTSAAVSAASDTWLTLANMPASRFQLAAATITNTAGQSVVYAIGGSTTAGGPLDKVTAYNVATNTWTFRRPLPRALKATNGAGVINGKIYVSGGFVSRDGLFPTSALYMYDPSTNSWTQKRDMPDSSYPDGSEEGPGARGVTGVINNRLYVVTGCYQAWEPWGYSEDCPPLFFRYNPGTDRWTKLPGPPAMELSPYAGGVIGGKFYVMGGTALAVYDPATNRWTTRTPLAQGRDGAATAVLNGKLYVLGGTRYNTRREAGDTLAITIVYDPTTDTWTRRAPLPSPRTDIAATVVFLNGRPRIEVVGGAAPGNNVQYVP